MKRSPSRSGATPRGLVRGPSVLEIRGDRGRISIGALRELWAYREVLWAFLVRQVKVKYKQAAVGVGWAVLQPLLSALLFALFLGRYAGVPSEGAPYLLFALAGLVPWTYFSQTSSLAMESLVTDQALLRKVYFPREALPLASVGAGLVDLVPALSVLVGVAAAFGVAPSVSYLALPVPVATLVLFSAALGLGLSGLNVYYRDIRHGLPFLVQLGLFASPVVYPLSVLPASWRGIYAMLNPVAGAVDGLRRIVVHRQWPRAAPTLGSLAWAAVLTVLAYWVFKRVERGFADKV